MSERITNHGDLSYRTRLLELGKAAAFAKALGANSRFTAITIETSARAKSEKKYFVQFLPSNPACHEAMATRQQDARAERAATQEFSFILDKDAGRPFLWCHSHASGEVYEVDCQGRSCSCPDFEFRCKANGLKCKHILAAQACEPGTIRTW